jgi:hypothetical protein
VSRLLGYGLELPSTVIAADDRDPWVSWRHHLERTGYQRGGVDIVAPVGTRIYSRARGRVMFLKNQGSAGNQIIVAHDLNPGWADVLSHVVNARAYDDGVMVERGDMIGWTGDSGGVSPHLHWHLLDPQGNRRNPWDYFTDGGSTDPAGGGTVTPIPTTPAEKEAIMDKALEFSRDSDGRRFILYAPDGVNLGFTSAAAYGVVRANMKKAGLAESDFVDLGTIGSASVGWLVKAWPGTNVTI